jgi:hypothetical protein
VSTIFCVRGIEKVVVRPVNNYSVVWDGHDLAGMPVPSGIYWARLMTAGKEAKAIRMVHAGQ